MTDRSQFPCEIADGYAWPDLGCFFFFQAEDGIRDADVTGVQTCALPISTVRTLERPSGSGWFDRMRATQPTSPGFGTGSARSEERRVGKEGRSRWSPYH